MLKWIVIALFLAVLTVRFHCNLYRIPQESMSQTIVPGDVIVCNEFAYGKRLGNMRTWGPDKVERGDLIIFNFPEGDTVLANFPDQNYYQLVRDHGRKSIHDPNFRISDHSRGWGVRSPIGDLLIRDVGDRTPYIKRCVAIPGDTVEVRNGDLYINGLRENRSPGVLADHEFVLNGPFNLERLQSRVGLDASQVIQMGDQAIIPLNDVQAEHLGKLQNVVSMKKRIHMHRDRELHTTDPYFPHVQGSVWTEDNFGPLWIPGKGDTVDLTMENLPTYERVIRVYENNELHMIGDRILINGQYTTKYVFEQDYHWVMGDNRHRSLDSRFWGFVPFDHIIGRTTRVLYSITEEQGFKSDRTFLHIQ